MTELERLRAEYKQAEQKAHTCWELYKAIGGHERTERARVAAVAKRIALAALQKAEQKESDGR